MKKYILKISLAVMASFFGFSANAQCPAISCPANITVNNDAGNCDAIVNYAAPVGSNTCTDTSVTLTYTGTIDNWTVPAGVTTINIEARGAEGSNNNSSGVTAGLGAIIIGDVAVTPGSTLSILVGQQYTSSSGNGGGGGTFVVDSMNNPLMIAGGGGGSAQNTDSPDKHGQVGTSGGTGAGGGGLGGTAGSGGNIGATFASGAGGGLLTDGADGWTSNTGGLAFLNGGNGGSANGNAQGGFGGGGSGSSHVVGGGGGGYSGGGSGSNSTGPGVGGGGASFNSGTNQNNTGGANSGNGQVIISWGKSAITTQTAGLSSGASYPVGVTTNLFQVTVGPLIATCSFTVTVVDTTSPTITCPANVVSCDSLVNGLAPTTTDNCTGETVSYILTGATSGSGSSDASGTLFNTGITNVQYVVTDAAGNQDSCIFTVEVLPELTGSVTTTICNHDSVVVNGTTYNAANPTGTEVFTNIGANNCDSTVIVNLNVLSELTGSVTTTICNHDSVVVNGTTYNDANPTGTEVFTNIGANNCDSTVIVNLNVLAAIDITVVNSSPTLTANQSGATYRWLDCNNNYSVIAGETGFSYTATANGDYAVEISMPPCVDTSACENINNVGINQLDSETISIYPNPTSNSFTVELEEVNNSFNYKVITITGKALINKTDVSNKKFTIDLSKESKGIYFLEVEMNELIQTFKVIKD